VSPPRDLSRRARNIAARDVEADHLGAAGRFRTEHLGERRREPAGCEEPVGVFLGLPQRHHSEVAVGGRSDVVFLQVRRAPADRRKVIGRRKVRMP